MPMCEVSLLESREQRYIKAMNNNNNNNVHVMVATFQAAIRNCRFSDEEEVGLVSMVFDRGWLQIVLTASFVNCTGDRRRMQIAA